MKLPRLILFIALLTSCASPMQVRTLTDLHQPEAQNQLLKMKPTLAAEYLKQDVEIPTLIEFSATWCVPCKELHRPLWQLAEASQGRYRVIEVDVTDDATVLKEFGLTPSLPAFLLKIPGSPKHIIRYGGGPGGPFFALRDWLQSADRLTKVPLTSAILPAPKAYKAMLIAGSAENANFLQELLWNYSWLLKNGMKGAEIGCFFGQPDVIQYADDRQQFDLLRDLIARCHSNNRQNILESLKLSLQKQPKNFYLYMSSHGAAPIETKLKEGFQKNCMSYAPALILDQEPADCDANRGLMPEDFANAMKPGPHTNKYLILQGCYTGGFISNKDDPKTEPSALAQLPNIRIMTASTADHASFGCNPGAQSTLFGYAYSREIIVENKPWDAIDWAAIHTKVSATVKLLEKDLPRKIRGSDPQYFAN